ncbi:MFS transporter [Saccharothrix sp. NPDC042600]|uniref:MFS transporter n=1 Tax=Saccharothrix TaxID=2071 RepID=UPI0033CEF567|nr:MFS transporter [Saccharothrix mutabilis subsp. capreolus]
MPVPSTTPVGQWKRWCAVVSVATGIFAIVTTEILPIGLLTLIGGSFAVSDGTAGLLMTMPGFLAAVAAPVVTVVTARVDRRIMLCAFTALLTLANVVTALAPDYRVLLVARVVVGVVIGGFWSIGAGLGARLVPGSGPRATAVVFSAVPLGSVLGVPAGTLLGELAGWRVAFAVVAVLSAVVLVALPVVLPPLPPVRATDLRVLRTSLRTRGTRAALLVTFLVVLAHFGAYTYVRPFLEQVTGLSGTAVTAVLLLYGTAGVVGNFLVGRHGFGPAAGLLAAATALLPFLGRWDAGAVVLLVVWGLAYGAVPVCSQALFTTAVPDAPEAASVLFTASFQATIGVGALAGGAVLDHASPSVVMLLGGGVAALAVVAIKKTARR